MRVFALAEIQIQGDDYLIAHPSVLPRFHLSNIIAQKV
jgi:hypothetical protein